MSNSGDWRQSITHSTFLTGFVPLVAGIGELSDRIGRLVLPCSWIVAFSGRVCDLYHYGGEPLSGIASSLFALRYGFGDTVAYISMVSLSKSVALHSVTGYTE
jgi:hypothetical protein